MVETDREETGVIRHNKTAFLALTGVLAGVYVVATLAFGNLSFGLLNLRFSNVLIGVVPILGLPGVIGITIGVFIGNIGSPLGPIDLISSLFSLIGLTAIYLLRKKSVILGFAIYSILLSIWVSAEITIIGFDLSAAYLKTFVVVLAGISLIVVGFAYVLYRALIASGLRDRVGRIAR